MSDITTLFEGTDGVSRTLFNQKLSDVNKHGNDAAMHVTAAERAAWNGKAEVSDIPASLKNPYALTLAGAVSGAYDGSTAKTFTIPTTSTNTTSVSGALTISTAEPTATLTAGKLWGVY